MTNLRARLLFCVAIVMALPATAAADGCNPFGNSPRPMVEDLTQLGCINGTMMAPWTDADGTTRRACLYEPASAAPTEPLPLIVYLHPSLFTADTLAVALENLSRCHFARRQFLLIQQISSEIHGDGSTLSARRVRKCRK